MATTTKTLKVAGITKSELNDVLAHFERFSSTYFWTPPAYASTRRREEKRNSQRWEFQVNGEDVEASVEIRCSCKNYYATRTIKVDGSPRRMMVPYLKKLIAQGQFE